MKNTLGARYMGSVEDGKGADITFLGCPLDATSSFRGGTKFAPDSIRKASWTLETYSPYLKRDLDDVIFQDAGDLELRPGDLEYSLDRIEEGVAEILSEGRKALVMGGEHLVTLPVLKAVKKHFVDLQVVHFDAHCDLRDSYEGQRLSHATVMKRVQELARWEFLQIGIRSGTRQEFEELLLVDSPARLKAHLGVGKPVYVTFDLDVLDPSLAPGVTTPEPGGLTFREVVEYFSVLNGKNIVGCDIVELSPDYDPTFVSSIAASKIVRELLMILHSHIQ